MMTLETDVLVVGAWRGRGRNSAQCSHKQLSKGLTMVARLRELTMPEAVLQHSRLLLVERMMVAAARRRTSCGAHYRTNTDSATTSATIGRRRRVGQSASIAVA